MTPWQRLIGALLEYRLVVFLLALLVALGGVYVAPFALDVDVERDPIPVDAIPDIGENQQIVFTEWPGRSPRDIEDQVTYPLTTALMGIPGVQTVRSSSALGFSTIYIIFDDSVEFYWSRSRVLEKLASLPPGTVPDGVTPTLGPDATALGQIFWYTLEGQDPDGNTVGGWDPDELRAVQDWTVRYALQSVEGVSEVSSVGGFVREYQVDVDPDAMRAHGVTLAQVANAVRRSNLDVGARTLEINGVEYLVRGLGFVEELSDLEQTVVGVRDSTPIRVADVGRVSLGPALRRGALDDEGAPAVGGVVVARYMENPLAVISGVKDRIEQIQPGLPRRTLEDGTQSQITIVPFYDRSVLIGETLQTLSTALYQQILITIIVVVVMLRDLRSSVLISGLLPLGVLSTFIVMKATGVDANIMALGGIAIAIGTMVDIGIVFVENINQHLAADPPSRSAAIRQAAAEVAPAVLTSVLTTVVSFLPVFGLSASELRLFAPLALTKTFAMGSALLLAIVLLPGLALLTLRLRRQPPRRGVNAVLIVAVVVLLVLSWMPLGAESGLLPNLLATGALIGAIMVSFQKFEQHYPTLLSRLLANKRAFLLVPAAITLFGFTAWLGVDTVTGHLPASIRDSRPVAALESALPGLGREYMPPFDEGAFLYMPTTMPHASIGEVLDMMSSMDAAIAQIPEVDRVVGKLGRADSALDPAPVSMIESVVTTIPEYATVDGRRVRQWRPHIHSQQDIWDEVTRAAAVPGLTSAPMLMPIGARLVMLQSGMRAPMGVKIKGPDLQSIESFGFSVESVLRTVPTIRPETVFADRVVGKPYLEIDLSRERLGRYGLSIVDAQEVLQVALGGMTLTRTVEGRERYPVRVRYMREERDTVEALERIFVTTPSGEAVPLSAVADIRYVRGPQVIKSEDTFPTSYVLFDRDPDVSEVEAVEQAQATLAAHIASGDLQVPDGVSFEFSGTYENQLRSERRLLMLVPLAGVLVFILLYLQFKRVSTVASISSGVLVAVSGGFVLLWLVNQPWLWGTAPTNLSVAVWIGVIALIGIATDDGVVMATYLHQLTAERMPQTVAAVRAAVLEAGKRRVRPCLMTTATTLLALMPVVVSDGRGSDIMAPMALPVVGGMAVELVTLFVVPVLFCAAEERRLQQSEEQNL